MLASYVYNDVLEVCSTAELFPYDKQETKSGHNRLMHTISQDIPITQVYVVVDKILMQRRDIQAYSRENRQQSNRKDIKRVT